MIKMVPIKLNKIFFSGLLRPQSSNRLLKNFRGFLSLEKKLETLQQDLYHCILAKSSTDLQECITLKSFRKGPLPFVKTKTMIDPVLLLPCVLASGVPLRNIKTIKAQLHAVTTSDWESFRIMTRGGAVIQEISWDSMGVYSPTIHEMIQEGKLLQFR